MLFSSAPALASRGHVFETTFGVHCIAEPGCTGAELFSPDGVAVNEATGDVYVVDKGEGAVGGRVVRFNKEGVFQGEFNGSGEVEVGGVKIEGIEAGSGGVAGESGGTGTRPGERGLATGRFSEPEGIAVDNSCALRHLSEPKCKEEDPSNGDVYVDDAGFGHRVIDKFDPEGKYLGQITEAQGLSGPVSFDVEPLDGVAVDPQGAVWVYREEPVVDGFTNGTPNKFVETISRSGEQPESIGGGIPGIAVDSEDNFYARSVHTGGRTTVSKFDQVLDQVPHGLNVLILELGGGESSAVAVEQTTNDSLIDNITTVGVFNPEGGQLERLGAGHLTQGAGIGVNAAAGSFYVADAAAGVVAVFGPVPPSVPSVESESVVSITSDSADLGAEINPRSDPGEAASEYHFQYGACATASTCASSPYESLAPVPDGQIEADYAEHAVSAHIQGLTAGVTYHFRVIAKNSHGEGAPGAERSFTTQGAGGALTLPDDRGWELVTPPDKQGSLVEPISEAGVVQAAAGGGAITYLTNAPTEAEPQGYTNEVQVLSRRAAASWSSRDIALPHPAATGEAVGAGAEYKFFDPELDLGAVQPLGQFIPELSAEASESTAYLHDLGPSCGGSCYHPLVTGKAGFANVPAGTQFGEEGACIPAAGRAALTQIFCGPRFIGASDDLGHVVLNAKADLSSEAGEGQLYEWAGGALAPVSVLPDGSPAQEETLGLKDQAARRAISSDGSRILWEGGSPPDLYLRDMGRGETVQLDKAQPCGECSSGGGKFQIASVDGSRVFFTDTHRLTEDSGAEPTGSKVRADLYECRIALVEEELACDLSDLTPKHGAESAEVQGGVLGASEDGSILYFVAKGVLSEEQNARGESAIAGKPNLYVREGASTRFIATLASGDNHDWNEELSGQPTRASNDGRFLELMSERPLTGYDNRDVASGKPAAEVYLYDAASNVLSCASCEPTGARPVGVEYHKLEPGSGGITGGPRDTWESAALVAANVPGWTMIGTGAQTRERYQPRYLNDAGRLFFNSADALVPQDANGTQDVYEYEPPGVGGCTTASPTFSARSGGCVALVSSGASAQESGFMDASESGDDVFFLTSSRLSPLDVDNARDIYDAHVCTTGSPCITFPTVQSPPCTTEASCKAAPTPQPSIFGAPASATFQGLGNPVPAAAAVVKAKAKPKTRAQKLAAALKGCKKKAKAKRAGCVKQARKKYGPLKKAKKKGRR